MTRPLPTRPLQASALPTRFVRPRPLAPGARVSVVIPCHDYARYLPAAVGSVLDQTGVVVDVMIVDDASHDDSLAVAHRLAAADPRVRVLANPTNRGPVATFNRGLAATTGEYLVRLDADDLLTPGSLARSVAALQAMPGAGFVYGRPRHFTGEPPRARTAVRGWTLWHGADWLAARCADASNVITSPEVVMRRSVVDLTGGQRELAHTHDMEMWLRLAAFADVAYVRGADQAWHREHPASLSTRAEEPGVILPEIRDAFAVLFADPSLPVPGAARLHAVAREAVGRRALTAATVALDHGHGVDPVLLELTAAVVPSAGDEILERLPAVLRRLHRRLRQESRSRRWARSGVYERLRRRN